MTTPETPGKPAAAPPSCPRHPDRVSYVRCQRCGRPTCPECAVPATVGVHCIDCVREARKAAPARLSALGAKVSPGAPVITYTIVALCVLSYVVQLAVGSQSWIVRWGFSPVIAETEPWRFVTGAFLHSASIWHIAMNMYALWIVGPYLEQILGRWRFTALYLLSAIGGHVTILLLADPSRLDWYTFTVGASGAVFGLFGAVFLVLRRVGQDARGMLILIGINLVFGFVFSGISWQGHVGGLVTGAILGAAYAYAPRERRREVGVGVTALVGVLLLGLVLLRFTQV